MSAIAPLISLILISFSISLNNGSFNGNLAQIITITVSFLILLAVFFKSSPSDESGTRSYIEITLASVLVMFALIPGGWWINNRKYIDLIQIFSALLLLPSIYLISKQKMSKRFLVFSLVFIIFYAAFLRFLMIKGSPYPAIDVFIILREAPLKLLEGLNPYNSLFTYVFPGIFPDYYAYWPASFILELPFIVIFKDPRILLILADLFASVLIFVIGGKSRTSLFLSMIYLFRPVSLGIIEASWLTPLDFFLICLITFVFYKNKNSF